MIRFHKIVLVMTQFVSPPKRWHAKFITGCSVAFVYSFCATASAAEKPLRPYLDVDMTHVVVRQTDSKHYAMYGGLTKLANGELFCLFKTGSRDDKGSPWTVRNEQIVWTQSTQAGRAWPNTASLIYRDDSLRQEMCCGKGYLTGEGKIQHAFYILNADYEEEPRKQNWSKLHLAETVDEGNTWSIRELDSPYVIAASFGGFVKFRDGTAVLNVYGAVTQGSFRHEAGLLWSQDDGKTWGDYTVIGKNSDPDGSPAKLNETDLVELPDGRLLAMSRSQYPGYPLYRSVSDDKGRTWNSQPSGMTGLCPALWHSSAGPPEGIVVLVWHDRWGAHADKGGLYVAFSHDQGQSFGEAQWFSPGAYPAMVETEPGKMFCSYYHLFNMMRGTQFKIPFPSGLHASAEDKAAVRLVWDAYNGSKSDAYEYQIHRGLEANFTPGPENLIATIGKTHEFTDTSVKPGTNYHYRVTANESNKRIGTSWITAARVE